MYLRIDRNDKGDKGDKPSDQKFLSGSPPFCSIAFRKAALQKPDTLKDLAYFIDQSTTANMAPRSKLKIALAAEKGLTDLVSIPVPPLSKYLRPKHWTSC